MSDNELLRSQTHIPRGSSGSVSRVAGGTGGGTVGVEVGAIHKELLHIISVCLCKCIVCMHTCICTFSDLLCCQSFFGKEDSEIIVGALHPKKLYLANCTATGSIT